MEINANEFRNYSGENNVIGSAVAAVSTVAPKIGETLGKVVDAGKTLQRNISKDGDKLFLADRDDLRDTWKKYGYGSQPDAPGHPTWEQFKINSDQVSGKSPRYDYAYERLQAYIKALLNFYNPGTNLGDIYVNNNPVVMRSPENVSHDWVNYAKAFFKTYPAGSFKGEILPVIVGSGQQVAVNDTGGLTNPMQPTTPNDNKLMAGGLQMPGMTQILIAIAVIAIFYLLFIKN